MTTTSCSNGKKKKNEVIEYIEVPYSRELLEQDIKRNRKLFENWPSKHTELYEDTYEEAYKEGYKKGRSVGYEEGYNDRQ